VKIRSAVPENGCFIFLTDEKNKKKQTKNKQKTNKKTKKHLQNIYAFAPHSGERGCVNKRKERGKEKTLLAMEDSKQHDTYI